MCGQVRQKCQGKFPFSALPVHLAFCQNFRGKQLIDFEHLKFHPVTPYFRGGVDKLQAPAQISVMVAGNFRNKTGGHGVPYSV
jgi:hypothetical protein